jgi:uncharacterized protein (TIGR02996 family)
MTDATGSMLLRAIIEEPDSDDLRLIYADWLQDHGDPARAEFIRLQCRLARMDEHDPERPALEDREADLLADHGDRWLADVPEGLAPSKDYAPRFRRGFLDEVAVDWRTFAERGDELFGTVPVGRLHIHAYGYSVPGTGGPAVRDRLRALQRGENTECAGRAETMAALAACPSLARVRRLDLRFNTLGPDHLATLFASRYLRGLDELYLDGNVGGRIIAGWPGAGSLRRLSFLEPLSAADVAALAASPHLGRLRDLNLFNCRINAESLRALVDSPTLARLKTLILGGNPLGEQGVALLASWSGLAGLGCLDLGRINGPVGLTDAGLFALTASPHLTRLRHLDLTRTRLGPAGLAALERWPVLADLHTLEMPTSRLGVEGARSLARARSFRPVRLGLMSNRLGGEGVEALALASTFDQVRMLNLMNNDIGPDGVTALGRSPRPALRWLFLVDNRLGDDGLMALAAGELVGLRELSLRQNRFGDRGVEALARSPILAGVRKLTLDSNDLTDASATALATSPYLHRAVTLSVMHTGISQTGLEALWERFGDRIYPRRHQWERMK